MIESLSIDKKKEKKALDRNICGRKSMRTRSNESMMLPAPVIQNLCHRYIVRRIKAIILDEVFLYLIIFLNF
jgi:hypothetical protein